MRYSLPRYSIALTVVAAGLVMLTSLGCEVPGFVAGMAGERVPAEYELKDRSTLIVVDDPGGSFGEARWTGMVAGSVGRALRENGVIENARLVPQQDLRALAAQLGADYQTTPIDRLGRLLDADQVIHVRINSVSLSRAPGVFEPSAAAEVKVIDAVASRRLFPDADGALDSDNPPPGHRVSVQMRISAPANVDESTRETLLRQLASHTGQRIAELFYAHEAPDRPGFSSL